MQRSRSLLASASCAATLILVTVIGGHAWQAAPLSPVKLVSGAQGGRVSSFAVVAPRPSSTSALHIFGQKTKEAEKADAVTEKPPSIEDTTEKYGLEAGLYQSLRSGDKGESAKSLLKKYGVAYLATSIPLAIVSFAICYFLVDAGVDVAALLSKVGITAGETTEKAGTFAIAYAAHKAASPIRFPPTVILTPVVAKLIGKEPDEGGEEDSFQ